MLSRVIPRCIHVILCLPSYPQRNSWPLVMELASFYKQLLPQEITNYLQALPGSSPKVEATAPKSLEIYGATKATFPWLLAALYEQNLSRSHIVVCRDNSQAETLWYETTPFLSEARSYYLPDYGILPYRGVAANRSISTNRIQALYHLVQGGADFIFTTVEAVRRRIIHPDHLLAQGLSFRVGGTYPQQEILSQLIALGFRKEDMVESLGQFANRGDILDIFSPSFANPIRLEFFDNELERITLFDPVSQTSLEERQEVILLPKNEIQPTETERQKWQEFMHNYAQKHGLNPQEFLSQWHKHHFMDSEDMAWEDFFPAVMPSSTIPEVLPPGALYVFTDAPEILERGQRLLEEYENLYQERSPQLPALPPQELLLSQEQLEELARPRIDLSLFQQPRSYAVSAKLDLAGPAFYRGDLERLRSDLQASLDQGHAVLLTSPFMAQIQRLNDILENFSPQIISFDPSLEETKHSHTSAPSSKKQELPLAGQISLFQSDLSSGFVAPGAGLHLLTDYDIFGRRYRKKRRAKHKNSDPLQSFLDIKPGDLVVHINHGIGKFNGLKRIQAAGKERDFLLLEYADEDTLYVPLDQISMVQRYIGSGDKEPRLDSLGGSHWGRVKERVKANVEELAQELIRLYSARQNLKGFSFPADTIWQEEFEALFPYEETPDQIQTIQEVKRDMEAERPMDRLVCGDVGFGKTEVAIRAAFKAAMAGKQTAFLVPTTVLSAQHYHTLKERFDGYPITVAMISRFVPAQEVRKIKQDLAQGEVDILIGTHALLNSEIKFKNLGLVIIDEEQRFGVKHKEKLKKYRTLVDVLTMSATPIPRTLHMSLAKMRDISVINTPPEGRKAVETYILEENPDMLKQALETELDRGGQAFYIHNRVETIEAIYDYIAQLMPRARVSVAHGQLPKHELEEVMLDFVERRLDILVSTTIVESGLDIPSVNTLIVNRADTFGLSQLYQLKGRVGRSGTKAYAYLFYPANRSLSEIAQKRLQVIHEYSDLGSGFKIAMRDLEIRGAGNILGPEQSGDIIEVGFELYMKLLDEAVNELSGEEIEPLEPPSLALKTDLFIPDDYISDTKQKIEIYKKLEAASSMEELRQVTSECRDRFGPPRDGMLTMLLHSEIRVLATQMRLEAINETDKSFHIRPGEKVTISPMAVLQLLQKDPACRLGGAGNEILEVSLNKSIDQGERLKKLKNVLQDLHNFSISDTDEKNKSKQPK